MIKSLTPIFIVDSIEAQLPFYEKTLGFTQAMAVPHGEALGFVGLVRDGQMLMLQTRDSLAGDMANTSKQVAENGGSLLYAEVDSLAETVAGLDESVILEPQRETFYGMREVWVRDPAGNVIGFAEKMT